MTDLPTTNELRDLLQYLTPQERAEMDSLINTAEPFADLPFEAFCYRYLRIQDKRGRIVPLQLNRAQRDLVSSLTGRDIVLKARQLGMSTVIQAWQFYQQMRGNARTSTLCHEDDLTSTLRRMADRFYNELPDALQPARKYANAKLTTYAELDSEGSIATVGGTAGERKGRGGSMTHIHGSEVAFWPDAEAVMGAALQAGNPDIILESTPNGMVGWFYERCMEALDGDSIWSLHFFPWWYDDEYRVALEPGEVLAYTADEQALVDAHGLDAEQIKWRRLKQKELGRLFIQEYPEDPYSCFLASGDSYFGDVSHVFTAPREATPEAGHLYVAGLDFGQAHDYTVLMVFDTVTRRQVDMLRINNLSWSEQRRRVVQMARKWNNATVWAEENSIGAPNIEELRHQIDIRAFSTTAQTKPPLIQGYYVALHEEGLTLFDDPVLRHELRSFISSQTASGHWRYEAQEGAHDDTVIAGALANHGMHAGAYTPGSISYAQPVTIGGWSEY